MKGRRWPVRRLLDLDFLRVGTNRSTPQNISSTRRQLPPSRQQLHATQLRLVARACWRGTSSTRWPMKHQGPSTRLPRNHLLTPVQWWPLCAGVVGAPSPVSPWLRPGSPRADGQQSEVVGSSSVQDLSDRQAAGVSSAAGRRRAISALSCGGGCDGARLVGCLVTE
jgi:hypothetical protein